MSFLTTFGELLKGLEKTFEGVDEQIPKKDPAKGPVDKFAETLTTIGDLFISIDQKSWCELFSQISEVIEDLLKLIAKFFGDDSPAGTLIHFIAKKLTGVSHYTKSGHAASQS